MEVFFLYSDPLNGLLMGHKENWYFISKRDPNSHIWKVYNVQVPCVYRIFHSILMQFFSFNWLEREPLDICQQISSVQFWCSFLQNDQEFLFFIQFWCSFFFGLRAFCIKSIDFLYLLLLWRYLRNQQKNQKKMFSVYRSNMSLISKYIFKDLKNFILIYMVRLAPIRVVYQPRHIVQCTTHPKCR